MAGITKDQGENEPSEQNISFLEKMQRWCFCYLVGVKSGRGGRCVFHLDLPSGFPADVYGPGGKIHLKNTVSIFTGDMMIPEWVPGKSTTPYLALYEKLVGDSTGFLIAFAEYNLLPAMYDAAVVKRPLHIELQFGHMDVASMNLVCKLYSPSLDAGGKRVLLMEGVINTMTINLVETMSSHSHSGDNDASEVLPLPDWLHKKMAGKGVAKALKMKPLQVPEGSFQYQTQVRWSDIDRKQHVYNPNYLEIACDAVYRAVKQKALKAVSQLHMDAGVGYCQVLYLNQIRIDQTVTTNVWETEDTLVVSSPMKSRLTSPTRVLCSINVGATVCCQVLLQYFQP